RHPEDVAVPRGDGHRDVPEGRFPGRLGDVLTVPLAPRTAGQIGGEDPSVTSVAPSGTITSPSPLSSRRHCASEEVPETMGESFSLVRKRKPLAAALSCCVKISSAW